MYYILKERYELQGWELLPFGVCDAKTGKVAFMSKEKYLFLYHMDGKHEIIPEKLSEEEQSSLDFFLKNGLIRESDGKQEMQERQKYHKYPSRFIRTSQWSITGRCNYRCRHCFMSAPDAKFGEISHEECVHIIHEMAACGIHTVSLTGGEPLVRKDFLELVDEMLKNGIHVTGIYTNGRLLTEKLLDQLEGRGVRPVIYISFDGIGWHDWLRGVPGAEENTLDALRRCQKRGLPTAVEMTVHKKNADSLPNTVHLMAELGVSNLKVTGAELMGEWAKTSAQYTLSLDELYRLFLDYIPEYFKEGMPLGITLEGCFSCPKGSTAYRIGNCKYPEDQDCSHRLICGHARNSLYISPEGYAVPCAPASGTRLLKQFPKIQERPLREILNDSFYMRIIDARLGDYLDHNPECRECRYKNSCGGGCRGIAIGEDGTDYFAKDEHVCGFLLGGYSEKVRAAADRAIRDYCSGQEAK